MREVTRVCRLVFRLCVENLGDRQHGRVVKATDLKSVGISRAGSNPAAVVFCLGSCFKRVIYLGGLGSRVGC